MQRRAQPVVARTGQRPVDERERVDELAVQLWILLDRQRLQRVTEADADVDQVRKGADRCGDHGSDARQPRFAGRPRPPHLDQRRHDQQRSRRPAQPGEQARHRRQPPAFAPQPVEGDHCEQPGERLRVAHDQHERRRRKREQPHGAPGGLDRHALEAGELEEGDAVREREEVDQDQQDDAGRVPAEADQPGEAGQQREEAPGLRVDPAVADPGDVAVEVRVPAEQTDPGQVGSGGDLRDLGRDRRRQRQGPDDEDAGGEPAAYRVGPVVTEDPADPLLRPGEPSARDCRTHRFLTVKLSSSSCS